VKTRDLLVGFGGDSQSGTTGVGGYKLPIQTSLEVSRLSPVLTNSPSGRKKGKHNRRVAARATKNSSRRRKKSSVDWCMGR
jgi:hypothetical protein